MTPQQFLETWLHANPKAAHLIATSVLIAMFIDRDDECTPILNPDKDYDPHDIDDNLLAAVSSTTLRDAMERTIERERSRTSEET